MSEQSVRPPAIPVPQATLASLLESVQALKQAVELLNGAAGENIQRSVSFVDLVNLGLIKKNEVPDRTRSFARRV